VGLQDVERGDNVKTPLSLGPFTVHTGKVPLSDVYLTQPRELTGQSPWRKHVVGWPWSRLLRAEGTETAPDV
jgi:hypothetical protein